MNRRPLARKAPELTLENAHAPLSMMIMNRKMAQKLRREKLEACLNCRNFYDCKKLGVYEECPDFQEVEGEAWVIRKL